MKEKITRDFLGHQTNYWATNKFELSFLNNLYGEEKYISVFAKLLAPTDIVFDIGAYIGTFGLSIAHLVHQVFLFEPDQINHQELLENINLNPTTTNVQALSIALGENKEVLQFHTANASDKTCPSFVNNDKNFTSIDTQVYSLDLVCQKYCFPSVIKIDTEGWELPILKGAIETLSHVRIAGIECHSHITQTYFNYNAVNIITEFMDQQEFYPYITFPRDKRTTHIIFTR